MKPVFKEDKSKSSKGLGLEGNLMFLSLVQYPHFRDVEVGGPRLVVADIYWAITITSWSALHVIPVSIFAITPLVRYYYYPHFVDRKQS